MYDFVVSNWAGILAAGTAVVYAVEKIVQLTPTKKDDEFVAMVENALDALGVHVPDAK